MENPFPYTNHLIHENSPYLLQHAHNPVDWHPWGDDALNKATLEDKMLIISIGYSACHWCHVMEHESFGNPEVALIMNEHFICIKVDREERPDVDQIYMNAAHLITGRGGWPLNALALPDGKPFYAGTYFPKDNWIQMLEYFVQLKKSKPMVLLEQAEKITNGIHSMEHISFAQKSKKIKIGQLTTVFDDWKKEIDFHLGGGVSAPKFPMPNNWEYLLQYHSLTHDEDALKAVTVTLDAMAAGGIYDHIGGGFARYSTDSTWHVPHFEKMLYDNAQLVTLYCHAFQKTKNQQYKNAVYETLEFISRELTSKDGSFYSALDADSEGEEGKFYVWTKNEIDVVLAENSSIFSEYYSISASGNWEEGKNILHRSSDLNELAAKHGKDITELELAIQNCKNKLLTHRATRIRPGLDDKIITSWNALMLKAYTTAYRVFDEDKFLECALTNANFLVNNMMNPELAMKRIFKNGHATINGFLDDYAFTISAFIDLYQATFEEQWLYKAKGINEYVMAHFYDQQSGMFFYTHDQHSNLIARKMEIADNVIPSSNSEMAKNLFILGHFFNQNTYIEAARQMLANVLENMALNPAYYSNWAQLATLFIQSPYEIAMVGNDCLLHRKELDKEFLPNVLFMGGINPTLPLLDEKYPATETKIYVCQDKICILPVTEVAEVFKIIQSTPVINE
jgi:uncharacterized protein